MPEEGQERLKRSTKADSFKATKSNFRTLIFFGCKPKTRDNFELPAAEFWGGREKVDRDKDSALRVLGKGH